MAKKRSAYYGKDYFAEMPGLKQVLQEYKPLTPEQERELLLRKEAPDARELLVYHNLRLVSSIVTDYQHISEANYMDLFQLGVEGLFKAIKGYDPDEGASFSTYATRCISGHVLRAVLEYRAFHLTEYTDKQLREMSVAEKKLTAELERRPTDDELAEELKISLEKLKKRKAIQEQTTAVSLHYGINGEDDQPLENFIEDDDMDLDEQLIHLNQAREVHKALNQLNPREKRVIMLHYGFVQEEGISQEKIAQQMGISKQRIQQVEMAAMKKLRKYYGQ